MTLVGAISLRSKQRMRPCRPVFSFNNIRFVSPLESPMGKTLRILHFIRTINPMLDDGRSNKAGT